MSGDCTVACDQVIFTSIRTPTGQGYRIVAASPGVRADEKAEITTRSPSHGSLCENAPDPVGLLTYQLASGRRCVGYVCHAGVEHTGRGGQRVYTHMVLLDRAAYRRFDSNPVRLHASLGEIIRTGGPMLKPPPHLEPLNLSGPGTSTLVHQPPAPTPEAIGWIGAIVAGGLLGKRTLLTGEKNPTAIVEWVLMSLPRALREELNASAEVRFSPSRGMHLVLLQAAEPQLTRQLAGQDIGAYAASTPPPPLPAPIEPWCRLLQRWWMEGRFAEIVRLTTETCADAPPETLGRLAAVCEDIDALAAVADAETLDRLSDRYPHGCGRPGAEQDLVARFHRRAEDIRSKLAQPVAAG